MTSIATTVIGLVGAVASPFTPHAANPGRALVTPESVTLCAAHAPTVGVLALTYSSSAALTRWASPTSSTTVASCDTSSPAGMAFGNAEHTVAVAPSLSPAKPAAVVAARGAQLAQATGNAPLAYTQKPAMAAQPAIRRGGDVSGLCPSDYYEAGAVGSWVTPPGCFGGIYSINPSNYVYRPGFGACNWWPEVLHPEYANVMLAPRHYAPVQGAAIYFGPGVQGAGGQGHYGEVVAVLNNGWLLISEMNFYWRGGGWGRVDYRYVNYNWGGMTFLY